jgi:hypothetical protein
VGREVFLHREQDRSFVVDDQDAGWHSDASSKAHAVEAA